jgi:hypothetical protein
MAEALLELDAPEAAVRWAERATANAPDHWWPSRAAILVALQSGDADAIGDALDTYGGNLGTTWLTLSIRRDRLLQAGELDAARDLFVEALPGLLADPPTLTPSDFYMAPILATIHTARGEDLQARELLQAVRVELQSLRDEGFDDFDLSEVEAAALLGNAGQALDLLEPEMTNDWMNLWWYILDSRNLAPLGGNPRFEALRDRVRHRMHVLRDDLDPKYFEPPVAETS